MLFRSDYSAEMDRYRSFANFYKSNMNAAFPQTAKLAAARLATPLFPGGQLGVAPWGCHDNVNMNAMLWGRKQLQHHPSPAATAAAHMHTPHRTGAHHRGDGKHAHALGQETHHHVHGNGAFLHGYSECMNKQGHAQTDMLGLSEARNCNGGGVGGFPAIPTLGGLGLPPGVIEIGRASCRERVSSPV